MPLPGAVPVMLSAGERKTLKKRVRGAKTAWRDRLRAQIVLAAARLDMIQVKDIRQWFNKLAVDCQCCAQGKTQHGQRIKSAAAHSGNAATKRYRHLAAKTHAIHCMPH